MRRNPLVIVAHQDTRRLYEGFTLPDEEVKVMSFGEAYCSLWRLAYDLVLLDCGVDPRTGLALVKDIKNRLPGVPVLFLTDESSEEIAVAAFRQGVRDYYCKPVNLFDLRSDISNLLEVKRQSREVRQRIGSSAGRLPEAGALCGKTDLPVAMMRVVCFVESHYREPLSLDEMSKLANMSKAHFCRTFKETVGMSPVKYLKFVRIERAKKLLRASRLPISEVAARVGFRDISNFNKNFRLFLRLSPSDYRWSPSLAKASPSNSGLKNSN